MIGKTLAHYKITDLLGKGGMGEVYVANDLKLGRNVALKLLSHRLASDSEALDRLQNEAKVLASLNHPGIVTIYSVDRFDEQPFLAMELVEGQTLEALIPERGLPLEDFLALAVPIADALGAAHEKGITHRDLKPANIMVTDTKRVKVLDFGLAKLHEASSDIDPDTPTEELDFHGQVTGTPQYMSPEQLRGSPVDSRSDVFSLGVVFYEMLAGHRPWGGSALAETIASIMADDPPPLSSTNPHVPARLARLVNQCLEKDPAPRPNSGIELRDDLVRIATVRGLTEPKPRLSIAVLPFADMSAEQNQAYFCEGMAEELINSLTHIEDLQVASRTSSFLYKDSSADIREIGRRLNVSSILEGSVRKAGDTLRITAQLIKVSDGYHLWSNHYDRQLADVFAIQDEISQSITQALQVTLTSGEEYSLHVLPHHQRRCVRLLPQRDERRFSNNAGKRSTSGLQMYSLAIKHDPDYALAFAGIADCHSYLIHDRRANAGAPGESGLRQSPCSCS